MSFLTIKEHIKTILQNITADGTAVIQEVVDYPSEEYTGYPAAAVVTKGNSSDYETTNANEELYAFTVYLFQKNDGPHDKPKAREIIEELCDQVRDTIDSDEFLDGISLPSGRTMLGVRPTVSEIFEEEAGKHTVAVIELAVKISKTV